MNEEKLKEKIAALEALLFYYGEPLELEKISILLEENIDNLKVIIGELKDSMEKDEKRGLEIIENNGKIEMVTKPKFSNILRKIFEEEFSENLTPAALETISIIAYLGPITRAQIDYIRGVNSTFILRNLLVRGLILRNLQKGKKNTYEYTVSSDFLKHLGLKNIEDLPEYEKYKNIIQKFDLENDNNADLDETTRLKLNLNSNSDSLDLFEDNLEEEKKYKNQEEDKL